MPSPAPSADDAPRSGPRLTRRQALGTLGALTLPLDQLLAQSQPVPPSSATSTVSPAPVSAAAVVAAPAGSRPPELPNFHDMMTWIAREQGPRLSFLDEKWSSLDAWKQAARPVFHRHLSYDPRPLPLSGEVVRREERDGFTLEVVNISATAAYSIPARILIPTKRTGRLPAVVAMHCHSGRYVWGHEKVLSSPDDSPTLTAFRDGAYGRPWAEVLARRGYVVIVIDAFYFGARRLRIEDVDATRIFPEVRDRLALARRSPVGSPEWISATDITCSFYEHITSKTILATGSTWPGLHVWDDMRTVDYLVSRPEVDPARIGVVGLSVGGLRTAHLIAADPRIKAASVTGWMTEFAQQLRNHVRHTWMIFIPGLYRSLDLPDAAALHAPGALLVQQCRRDTLYPAEAMQSAVDKLARIYAKAGIPERFRGTFYDEPHSFKPAMQDETFAWLDRWL